MSEQLPQRWEPHCDAEELAFWVQVLIAVFVVGGLYGLYKLAGAA